MYVGISTSFSLVPSSFRFYCGAGLPKTSMEKNNERIEEIASAFRKVLGEDEYTGADGNNRRLVLIKRIPIICQDVMEMKGDIRDMKSDYKWIKWLVVGIAGGIGALLLIFLSK